jgi:hypothetical protein
MVYCETILAEDAGVNAETSTIPTLLGGSAPLTTRIGKGKPKITHMWYLASTNDINRVYVVPQGMVDQNGIPIDYGVVYGATAGLDMAKARLKTPIELAENCLLTIYATSETAANTVVQVGIILEYPTGGKFVDVKDGPLVRRAWEHGAALTSLVEANSTDITDLLPNRQYQPAHITGVGVNGFTAGLVGPAYIRFRNAEMEGAAYWLPLVNAGAFVVAGIPNLDLRRCGLKIPVFTGGTNFMSSCVGYTAEQPQAEIAFATGSIFS